MLADNHHNAPDAKANATDDHVNQVLSYTSAGMPAAASLVRSTMRDRTRAT